MGASVMREKDLLLCTFVGVKNINIKENFINNDEKVNFLTADIEEIKDLFNKIIKLNELSTYAIRIITNP
jgi:hypothetical protein